MIQITCTLKLTLLLLTVSLTAIGQAPVREIAPGVFYYFGDEKRQMSANCTWIVFRDYVLAVDANYPWGAEEILREIRSTTDKPVRFVFNTHYHHDHTFGNFVFSDSGAAIVSTQAAAQEMRTSGMREWNQRSAYSGRNMNAGRREFPAITFTDRLIFDDSIHRAELVMMGPAHTAGDGIVYLPKEKILITGDLFVHGNPWGNNVADENANYDRWLSILDTLISWNPTIVIPGHGEPTTTRELVNQRLYLADMLKQVRQAIRAGKTKQQTVEQVTLDKHPVYGDNKVSTRRSVGAMYDRLRGEKVKR